MKGPKEAEISKQIRKFLGINKILHWKVVESPWCRAGLADICGVLPGGRHLEVEIKRPGLLLRPNQAQHLDMVNNAGGLGICVHSVKELQESLDFNKVHLKARLP